jgi:hypothetical protein
MNAAQYDWMNRMQANVATLREQYYGASAFDNELLAETLRKVREAVKRLKLKVISLEENAANHEFWDGEADARVEWLAEALRIIGIYTAEPDDVEINEDRLYELEMDRRHYAVHGGDPEWAQ